MFISICTHCCPRVQKVTNSDTSNMTKNLIGSERTHAHPLWKSKSHLWKSKYVRLVVLVAASATSNPSMMEGMLSNICFAACVTECKTLAMARLLANARDPKSLCDCWTQPSYKAGCSTGFKQPATRIYLNRTQSEHVSDMDYGIICTHPCGQNYAQGI